MKRTVTMLLVCALFSFSLAGCGSNRTINGVTYGTYGLFNVNEKKNPDIQYELIVGNLIWGIVLVETIVAPIYFFGFSLFEPVGPKPAIKGQVVR